jgi:hypothetical protein
MSTAAPPSGVGFDDLDYPGRRKPVNRGIAVPKSPEPTPWDHKPVFYLVNGERQEFFVISHVAKALGYSVQSIRAWEDKGVMPRTPYRSPRTRGMIAGGRSNKGRRLWTREQIEGLLRLAEKHRVILNKKPPTMDFARELAAFYASLIKQ